MPPSRRWTNRLILLHPGEGRPIAFAAAAFFFLLLGYFIIRPIRDEMGLAGGINNLAYLWTGTLAAMLAVHPVYSWIVGRLPRRRFIPLVYRFFILNLVLFYAAIELVPREHQVNLGRVFYVWTSVFNLFAVAVFWSFITDVFTHEQGKRLFGAVAVGGTLGAMAGSAATGLLTSGITIAGHAFQPSTTSLLLVSAVMIEAAVQCLRGASGQDAATTVAGATPAARAPAAPRREPTPQVWAGLATLIRSPYLLLIAGVVLCYTVTSTFLYVEQLRIAEGTFQTRQARTAFFAQVNFWVNAGTLLVQLFLTARIVRTLGVGATLLIVPVIAIAGFTALWLMPAIWVFIAVQVTYRASHFAFDKPAREVLYTIVSPDARYKSKHLIDTFIYRAGDQVGIWGQHLLAYLAIPIAAAAIVTGGIWAATAAGLGRLHARRAATVDPPQDG